MFEDVLGLSSETVIHMEQQAMCSPGHYYPSPAWSPPSSEADYATGGLVAAGLGMVKSEPLSPQSGLIGAGMSSPRAGHTAPSITPPPSSALYHAHMPSTEHTSNSNSITGYAPLTPPYNNSTRCDRNGQSPSQSMYWLPTSSTTPPPYESEYYSGTCSPSHEVHETKYSEVHHHHHGQHHHQSSSLSDKQIIIGQSHNGPTNSANHSNNATSVTSSSHNTNGCLDGLSDEGAFEQLRAICLQQAASDVNVACNMLNISPNPYSWDVQDVQRWIMWLVKEKRLEYAAEHMHVFYKVSGAQLVTLCDNYQKMSTQQSPQLAPAQRIMIEAVCAHLDIWKSAAQTMNCVTNISAANASNIKSSNNHVNSNNNRGNCHNQHLQIVSGIISSEVSSQPSTMQPEGCDQQLDEIDLLPYQLSQVSEYAQPPQHQHVQYSTVQQVMNPSQLSGGQTLKYSLATHEGSGLEMQLNAVSSNCSSAIYPIHSSPPLYVDLNEDAYSDDEDCSSGASLGHSGGGQHIHLWQFLKELLSDPYQHKNCIRWQDRSKGIFKIEDSVRVAKLWGRRKNRPAMNYDKLSRSIRQYYRKGIMKKTERSQRLVYQFCPAYAN